MFFFFFFFFDVTHSVALEPVVGACRQLVRVRDAYVYVLHMPTFGRRRRWTMSRAHAGTCLASRQIHRITIGDSGSN
ncbi:hypothetical protein V8E55_009092 [Tylopilus felleus]